MDQDLLSTGKRGRLRRWALRLLATLGVLLLAITGAASWVYVQARESNVGDLTLRNQLHIPPLLEPTVDDDGRKRFELTMQTGRSEFLPGTSTDTWGINGDYLGPTLRASKGDQVAIDVVNNLPETSTLHWHGMRLPARMDGGPHQMIEPGQTWSPYWTVDQPAASLWVGLRTTRVSCVQSRVSCVRARIAVGGTASSGRARPHDTRGLTT